MRLICAVLRRLVAKLISLPKVGRRAISCRSPRPVVARAVFGEDICVPAKCRLQRPQGALDGLRRATGIVDGCRALHGLKSPRMKTKRLVCTANHANQSNFMKRCCFAIFYSLSKTSFASFIESKLRTSFHPKTPKFHRTRYFFP